MNNHLTSQTKITGKYQTVVPLGIRESLDIKKGEILIWKIIQHKPTPLILVLPKPKNWSNYLSGLGKRVWKNVNTDKYLAKLKSEWQE